MSDMRLTSEGANPSSRVTAVLDLYRWDRKSSKLSNLEGNDPVIEGLIAERKQNFVYPFTTGISFRRTVTTLGFDDTQSDSYNQVLSRYSTIFIPMGITLGVYLATSPDSAIHDKIDLTEFQQLFDTAALKLNKQITFQRFTQLSFPTQLLRKSKKEDKSTIIATSTGEQDELKAAFDVIKDLSLRNETTNQTLAAFNKVMDATTSDLNLSFSIHQCVNELISSPTNLDFGNWFLQTLRK